MFFSDDRLSAVAALGSFLRHYTADEPVAAMFSDLKLELDAAVERAYRHNGWFTTEHIHHALHSWGMALSEDKLAHWRGLEGGPVPVSPVRVGIVMAGNIPLVGLHDFLSVFLSGHHALIKLSSDDAQLLPVLLKVIVRQDALFEADFTVVDRLEDLAAVIATGSDNTSRYFEHYFGRYPNVIRKNRTSIAVLDGSESDEELRALGEDIFRYFGLGCRNVSHLLLPSGFDIQRIFANIVDYSDVINNNKYGNNYDYYRAIYLLNQDDFLENGFLLTRESDLLHTPVAQLHYSFYQTPSDLAARLEEWDSKLQCIIGHDYLPFGTAQTPELWDYADGVNTMQFLRSL